MRMTILVIEDDAETAALVAGALARVGWSAEIAVSGRDGRRRVAAGGIDLVLLDYRLPDEDGITCLQASCARPRRRRSSGGCASWPARSPTPKPPVGWTSSRGCESRAPPSVRRSKAIDPAVGRIRQIVPALGHHLSTHVKTGTCCVYRPHPSHPFVWRSR